MIALNSGVYLLSKYLRRHFSVYFQQCNDRLDCEDRKSLEVLILRHKVNLAVIFFVVQVNEWKKSQESKWKEDLFFLSTPLALKQRCRNLFSLFRYFPPLSFTLFSPPFSLSQLASYSVFKSLPDAHFSIDPFFNER